MLGPTLTIARNTLVESLRQPVFFVVILCSAIAQYLTTAMTGYSMGYKLAAAGEVTGDDKMLLEVGLATVFVAGIVLASFVATAAISREIENKTVLTVVSKPIGRPALVVGKFLGIAASIMVGSVVLVSHLLFAMHHGVMSTAADDVHWPVIVLAGGAFLAAVAAGGFGNFWYGWSFNQTFVLVLVPLSVLAYGAVLPLDTDWGWSKLDEVVRPQVFMVCAGVVMALLVMSAVATAASTRLGQVMTMVVCLGVFMLGLLSNTFIGRLVFDNVRLAGVAQAAAVRPEFEGLGRPGAVYDITLDKAPDAPIDVGDPFYYGPAPNGIALAVPSFTTLPPAEAVTDAAMRPGAPPGLVVIASDGPALRVRHVGGSPLAVRGPPMPGDSVFVGPTKVNALAFAAWAVVPNLHNYWMVDAVTQASPIPPLHLAMIAAYAVCQIGACLAAAVLLFQGRDVG